jgi:poly-gamma-glutamate capsule biosynthesis protein CapA/YwtB (metallophosphatase superfamily)
MNGNFWFKLGQEAAIKMSAMAAGGAPIKPRFVGKFMRKATGSTKRTPHHGTTTAMTAPTGVKI